MVFVGSVAEFAIGVRGGPINDSRSGDIEPLALVAAALQPAQARRDLHQIRERSMYHYHAIDSLGDTVEFGFSEYRDLPTVPPHSSPAQCMARDDT